MRQRPVPRRGLLVLVLALSVVVAACGGAQGGEATASDDRATVPAVDVVELATGDTVPLASVVAADRPTLLWIWAPH